MVHVACCCSAAGGDRGTDARPGADDAGLSGRRRRAACSCATRRPGSASATRSCATRAASSARSRRRASASRPTHRATSRDQAGCWPRATSSSSRATAASPPSKADFDTQHADRHFLQRLRVGLGQRQVDTSFFGTQEPDAYLLRRDDREDRRRPVPHHARAGSRPACSRRRAGRWRRRAYADARQACRAQERGAQGQERADVLPAGDVLPDQQGGPGDRVPAAALRRLDATRDPAISNAFFWAINRSQDMTLMHDWFTPHRHGATAASIATSSARGSTGEFRIHRHGREGGHLQSARAAAWSRSPSVTASRSARNVVQALPAGIPRARATSTTSATSRCSSSIRWTSTTRRCGTRSYQGNVSGALGRGNNISASYGINEIFYGDTDSQTIGGRRASSSPRADQARAAAALFHRRRRVREPRPRRQVGAEQRRRYDQSLIALRRSARRCRSRSPSGRS